MRFPWSLRKSAEEDCVHMLSTDKTMFEMAGISLDMSKEKRLLNKSLLDALIDTLSYLDQYQYYLCRIAHSVKGDNLAKDAILEKRISIMKLITDAAAALFASISNPEDKQIQSRIESVLASIISAASSAKTDVELSAFEALDSKDAARGTKSRIESLEAFEKILPTLSKSFPEINTEKRFLSGNIEVNLARKFKGGTKIDLLVKRIKDFPGVVDLWFSDGKSFDILVEIEVGDYDEAANIESEIKSIPGVESVELSLETRRPAS